MTAVSSTSSTASTTAATPSSALTTSTSGSQTTTSVDWTALIAAEVAQEEEPATSIQTNITANEAKIAAYQALQTLVGAVATDTASMANSIVNSLSTSIYGARAATLTSTGDVSASAALSMTISNGAATGTHTLTVSQLATAQKVIGTSVASDSTALGYTGTFSLGLAGGTSTDISITSGMTMQDVADAINAQSSTTNVQASIIQVSSSSYEMILSATNDNADIQTSSVSGNDVLTNLGITDSTGAFTDVLQAAQPAIFTLDKVSLSRNTNDVTDVLSGVTFNLLQATPSGSAINIDIEPDTSSITTALQTFVTDYNAVRSFVNTQQTIGSDGTVDSSEVLFGDGTMRNIMTEMEAAVNSSVNGMSLSDLGLSFSDTNQLQLDTSTLSTELSNNLSGVISLLASTTTTSSSTLSVVNTSASPPASFVLDLATDSSGNLTSASVNGDSTMFTVSGDTIIGAAGTAYAGMAFTYSGSSSASITVTSTAGIAAQLNSVTSSASNASTGTVEGQITTLQSDDTAMQSQIADIDANGATYQAMLTTEYANYQAAISTADSNLSYLSALLNSSSNSG